MDEVLMKIEGQNGSALAYEDRVVFSRKGFKGFMAQGFGGDRTFYYKDITSVDFRKPSFVANGYLKILVAGVQDNNKEKVNLAGTTMDAFKDPNTLALRAFKKDTANKHEEFYNLIMKKINEVKNMSSTSNNSTLSAADEIKKYKDLLDAGAITQEEFEAKKKELLNL